MNKLEIKAHIEGFANYIFPFFSLKRANNHILGHIGESLSKKRKEKYDEFLTNWQAKLSTVQSGSPVISRVNDLFDQESHRKDAIEQKASAALTAVSLDAAIATSVLSIVLNNRSNYGLSGRPLFIFVALFLAAIVYFLVAGYCSLRAVRVEAVYVMAVRNLDEIGLSNNNFDNEWMAKQLTDMEMNQNILVMKSNFVSVAHQLLVVGIFLFVFGGLTFVWSIISGIL